MHWYNIHIVADTMQGEGELPTGDIGTLLLRVGQRMSTHADVTPEPSPSNTEPPYNNFNEEENFNDATQNTPTPDGSVHSALLVDDMSLDSSQESQENDNGFQDEMHREVQRSQRFKVESVGMYL